VQQGNAAQLLVQEQLADQIAITEVRGIGLAMMYGQVSGR